MLLPRRVLLGGMYTLTLAAGLPSVMPALVGQALASQCPLASAFLQSFRARVSTPAKRILAPLSAYGPFQRMAAMRPLGPTAHPASREANARALNAPASKLRHVRPPSVEISEPEVPVAIQARASAK